MENEKKSGTTLSWGVGVTKNILKDQIKDIERYRNEFDEPKKGMLIQGIEIVLTDRFEMLKTLDKVMLTKYFEKDEKELAGAYVSSMYQLFGILEKTTQRLDQQFTEFHFKLDEIADSYFEEINSFKKLAIIEADKLVDYTTDPLLKKLFELAFSKNSSITAHELLKDAKELSEALLKEPLFKNSSHPLYQPILDFALRGSHLRNKYVTQKIYFKALIESSYNTYKLSLADLENTEA